jgi:hypothetical protein
MGGGRYLNDLDWGKNSCYHHALLGFFGILKYLSNKGLLNQVLINLVTFSNKTKISGFKSFNEIKDIKEQLFSPEFQSTYLDIDKVTKTMDINHPYAIIMISDGQIFNWNKDDHYPRIADKVKELAKNNQFCFIQVGSNSDAYKDLTNSGFNTYYINDAGDLTNLIIDLTRKAYERW